MAHSTTEPAALSPLPLPTAAAILDAELVRIPMSLPPPFVPCNPSIHYDGYQWRCSVRTVDYRLGVIAPDGGESINYMLELDRRLGVADRTEMSDRSGIDKNPWARVRGYEDLRLFTADGGLSALATASDIAGGGLRPELVRLEFGAHGQIVSVAPLRGPWSYMPQKNWTPVADGVGRKFLYRVTPRLVVEWRGGGKLVLEIDERHPGFAPSSVRGSSQAIPFDGGWLVVVHSHVSTKPMIYSHRFIWLDRELEARKFTPAFSWTGAPVEFCAGLASDGQQLVASFGVNDCEAWLAVITPYAVRERLVRF